MRARQASPLARNTVNAALPKVLLTNGSFYGTLAAARYFGRMGWHVAVADHGRRSASQYSRFVSERLECPDRSDFEGLVRWLVDLGAVRPGWLLYPCSDDMAWVIAGNLDRLTPYFALLQPSFATIETLLNKQKLYELCGELGIPTPVTAHPENLDELVATAERLKGRYLVKPKTRVGSIIGRRPTLTEGGASLVRAYTRYQRDFRRVDAVLQHDPSLGWPMIQEFNPSASTQTSSVAGFRSRGGASFHVLSSRKTLQYPLNLGVGLCFEAIPVQPELVEHIRRICEATEYFGAFEVEFVRSGDRYELIDFNPRYYGQMQLEISRGLPIPGLVAAASLGLESVRVADPMDMHSANYSLMKLIVTTQWIGGRISSSERRRWLAQRALKESRFVDHVYAADDRRPWLVDILQRWLIFVRHPRFALRTLFGSE